MKPETINLLYKIQDQCKAIRNDMDGYMHGDIPQEDKALGAAVDAYMRRTTKYLNGYDRK